MSRKVNHLSKVVRDRKIVHQVYQFHQKRLASRYDGIKCPKTNTLAYGLIKRTSSILDELESKTIQKDEAGHQ